MVICAQAVDEQDEVAFSDLRCCTMARNASTMSNSYGGAQSYESGQQEFALCTKLFVGVVSLSVFGGNFALAKVRLGLISLRCTELRGVRSSEVWNVLYSSMVKSIRGKRSVRCREVVRFSESPLLLYY